MNERVRDQDGVRMNQGITASTVRVIDQNGEMLGVMNLKAALDLALNAGLDLIEISPNAEPPVCKILDSGKYKYEQQKKKAEARKNQKVVEIKEIKLRPVTGENDYQVKLKSVRKFLSDGNKVKITVRYRGREITHQELGRKILERMCVDTGDIGKIELAPKMEGKQMVTILATL